MDREEEPGSPDGIEDPLQEDLDPISNVCHTIRERVKFLSLCRTEQCRAAEMVNHLRDSLTEFLKHCDQPYFQSINILNTGSYYEMVKIDNPDEFDMMLLLPTQRLTWTELPDYDGVFYSVSLARPTRTDIQNFLLEDGLTISATKVLEEMRRVVRKFLSTYNVSNGRGHWSLTRKRPTSPAVTLELKTMEEDEEGEREQEADEGRVQGQDMKEQLSVDIVPALEVSSRQRWPTVVRQGLNVERWLGNKVRRSLMTKAFYFVPKRPPGRNLSSSAKESWRISFSHIEKEIIMNHGNKKTCCQKGSDKCCRKLCLRLLKCLIKGLKQRYAKELETLCSYHGKTLFLHELAKRCSDAFWAQPLLPRCFQLLLDSLEVHVRDASLPHFFVPVCNLFAPPAFPCRALRFLQGVLQEQRRLGLPLLRVVQPEQPLSANGSVCPSSCTASVWFTLPHPGVIAGLLGLILCCLFKQYFSEP